MQITTNLQNANSNNLNHTTCNMCKIYFNGQPDQGLHFRCACLDSTRYVTPSNMNYNNGKSHDYTNRCSVTGWHLWKWHLAKKKTPKNIWFDWHYPYSPTILTLHCPSPKWYSLSIYLLVKLVTRPSAPLFPLFVRLRDRTLQNWDLQ